LLDSALSRVNANDELGQALRNKYQAMMADEQK